MTDFLSKNHVFELELWHNKCYQDDYHVPGFFGNCVTDRLDYERNFLSPLSPNWALFSPKGLELNICAQCNNFSGRVNSRLGL